MNKMVFILDESGAKGYSNKTEKEVGELGVMAGYILPKEYIDTNRTDLDTIRGKYFSGEKIHITDLTSLQQEMLRNEIFNYFLHNQIYIVYEAIYVQGYFDWADSSSKITKAARHSLHSKIKFSLNEKYDLLHATLFQGAFGKAIAFCIDFIGGEIKLDVVTDRVDKPLIKLFQQEADNLLSVEKDKTHEVTGFDTEKKELVKGSISTSITSNKEALGDFSRISYSISCEDSSLTLAADVIANSINYHLKSLQTTNPGIFLNTTSAISDHPLSSLVYGSWNNTEINYFSDAIYMHPTKKNGYDT